MCYVYHIVMTCEPYFYSKGVTRGCNVLVRIIRHQSKVEDVVRSRGYWKFNNSLLDQKEFVDRLIAVVNELLEEGKGKLTPSQLRELVKFNIGKFSLKQSTEKARKSRMEINELHNRIKKLEDDLALSLEDNTAEINSVKSKIQDYYERKTKSSIFRCKARWLGEGERSSKYFFNLEKLRFNNRTMVCLVREDKCLQESKRDFEYPS